jgi:hypothetical protein
MTPESFTLHGKHVRLEPLEHRHVDGQVGSAGAAALYQWSPVPRGKVEATEMPAPHCRSRLFDSGTAPSSGRPVSRTWNDGLGRKAMHRTAVAFLTLAKSDTRIAG